MTTLVLSRAPSFERHVLAAVASAGGAKLFKSSADLPEPAATSSRVLLIHAPSFKKNLSGLIPPLSARKDLFIGIAADAPNLEQMLSVTQLGARAYFNSYMADTHYHQMLRLLEAGQSWFAPELLARALELAHRTVLKGTSRSSLNGLTSREKEIAMDVGEGLSNKQIAASRSITERTVKAHLTRIFKKLGINSRYALGMKLRPGVDRAINDS